MIDDYMFDVKINHLLQLRINEAAKNPKSISANSNSNDYLCALKLHSEFKICRNYQNKNWLEERS